MGSLGRRTQMTACSLACMLPQVCNNLTAPSLPGRHQTVAMPLPAPPCHLLQHLFGQPVLLRLTNDAQRPSTVLRVEAVPFTLPAGGSGSPNGDTSGSSGNPNGSSGSASGGGKGRAGKVAAAAHVAPALAVVLENGSYDAAGADAADEAAAADAVVTATNKGSSAAAGGGQKRRGRRHPPARKQPQGEQPQAAAAAEQQAAPKANALALPTAPAE